MMLTRAGLRDAKMVGQPNSFVKQKISINY